MRGRHSSSLGRGLEPRFGDQRGELCTFRLSLGPGGLSPGDSVPCEHQLHEIGRSASPRWWHLGKLAAINIIIVNMNNPTHKAKERSGAQGGGDGGESPKINWVFVSGIGFIERNSLSAWVHFIGTSLELRLGNG